MSEPIHLIYHRDADGFLAAVIAAQAQDTTDIVWHSINYGEAYDFLWDLTGPTYVLDFSFPEAVLARLHQQLGDDLVWIDHHHTAIEAALAYQEYDLSQIAGVRLVDFYEIQDASFSSPPVAACELTDLFFNGKRHPLTKHIGDWDVWRWKDHPEVEGPRELNAWVYTLPSGGDPADNEALCRWIAVLHNWVDMEQAIGIGAADLRRQVERNAGIMAAYAYDGTFAGYPALLVNSPYKSSELFVSRFDPTRHQLMVVYQEVQGCYWTVSLYAQDPTLDCGTLARQLGDACPDRTHIRSTGGGHRGAAGFQTTREHLFGLIETA